MKREKERQRRRRSSGGSFSALMRKQRSLHLPMPSMMLRTKLEGTNLWRKPETRGRTKRKPQPRSFGRAETLHSGRRTSYIFDYINDETIPFLH
jgi:hypothetical protein